jgi:rod shape determining protein RodA
MREEKNLFKNIDWVMVNLYLAMVLIGWMNIYAAVYNESHSSIFDLSQNYGKQLIWIVSSFAIAGAILLIDGKFFAAFSYPLYAATLVLLVVVLLLARKVSGAAAWLEIGNFKLQPAEFAKFATNMALAKYLSTINVKIQDFKSKFICLVILSVPTALILLQNDTGSALVFTAFIFVLYREGLSGGFLLFGAGGAVLFVLTLLIDKYILIGILAGLAGLIFLLTRKNKQNITVVILAFLLASSMIYSVDYVFEKVLEPHQKERINVLLGKEVDLKGSGYNVNQSMIAIGSGGFWGKGYLQGTQTKFDFVPEQSTDFIFCTVGEEWGFVGSFVVLGLFVVLLFRIIYVAERQRSSYSRIYGYGVASILLFHLLVNIGMTIGLAPVIGIPLPFFSYGGSSLWGFTILLFVFIKLDSYRLMVLR